MNKVEAHLDFSIEKIPRRNTDHEAGLVEILPARQSITSHAMASQAEWKREESCNIQRKPSAADAT
jgi:hypothetical protein